MVWKDNFIYLFVLMNFTMGEIKRSLEEKVATGIGVVAGVVSLAGLGMIGASVYKNVVYQTPIDDLVPYMVVGLYAIIIGASASAFSLHSAIGYKSERLRKERAMNIADISVG